MIMERPHHLDSYYVVSSTKALEKLNEVGYAIKEDAYTNREHYMKYPYLLLHDGYIELCHDRHLNRDDLYGENTEMTLKDGHFWLLLD